MNIRIRDIFKWLTPPVIVYLIKLLSGSANKCVGEYASYYEALLNSHGYDSAELLKKIIVSNQLVLVNSDLYERDGVVFDKYDYSYELNSVLLLCYVNNGLKLNVLDYGGALGTTYRQFIYFSNLKRDTVTWTVAEQTQLAEYGKSNIILPGVEFIDSRHISNIDKPIDALILSATLEFLEDPEQTLNELIKCSPKIVVIDRAAIWDGDYNFLGVMRANKVVSGSYPCWIFSEKFMLSALKDYEVVSEWVGKDGYLPFKYGYACYKGYYFRRINDGK